jgi:hypothetical protein
MARKLSILLRDAAATVAVHLLLAGVRVLAAIQSVRDAVVAWFPQWMRPRWSCQSAMLSEPEGTPTDQLLNRFFRRRQTVKGKVTLQVAIIQWRGSHDPYAEWHDLAEFETSSPQFEERIQAAKLACLNDPRFFRSCEMCHELCNSGHMHDSKICQGCAGRHLGIRY